MIGEPDVLSGGFKGICPIRGLIPAEGPVWDSCCGSLRYGSPVGDAAFGVSGGYGETWSDRCDRDGGRASDGKFSRSGE